MGAIPKFNFVPEKQLGASNVGSGYWKLSILKSNTTMYFPKDMASALEMDGKYYRLFADKEKKSIGWSEVKGKIDLENLNDARLAKSNKNSGAVLFGIGKILQYLDYELKDSIKNLEVKTHISPLMKDPVQYIILPDVEKPYTKEE